MRRWLSVAALSAACASTPAADPASLLDGAPPAPVGRHPPLAEVARGRVVLVDLWASWCEPCVEAIPALIRLERTYRPGGLVVVGVNVGEDPETARAFAEKAGITYPVYVDPEFALADRIGSRNVPTILVVDRSGKIVRRGSRLDKETLALLRELLK
jgi:thiol-disulfide isomerase/thioredoxin